MADMRRHDLEPPPGDSSIEHQPGLASAMLRDVGPLLAEEGIDIDNLDVADFETLQAAMDRAVERRNMELFSPVGAARDIAVATLRLVVEAILEEETTVAGTLLDQVVTDSPDNTAATGASCIGISLGLLDDLLCGHAPEAPTGLARRTILPAGHWTGERAARDILVLARKGRAFASLDKLFTRQGGPQVLAGSALALAATLAAWMKTSETPQTQLIKKLIR